MVKGTIIHRNFNKVRDNVLSSLILYQTNFNDIMRSNVTEDTATRLVRLMSAVSGSQRIIANCDAYTDLYDKYEDLKQEISKQLLKLYW